jgi:hypothetical protein
MHHSNSIRIPTPRHTNIPPDWYDKTRPTFVVTAPAVPASRSAPRIRRPVHDASAVPCCPPRKPATRQERTVRA